MIWVQKTLIISYGGKITVDILRRLVHSTGNLLVILFRSG